MANSQTKKIRLNQLLEFACLLAAFWPIWTWYVRRSLDASDEPWGLISLASAALCLFQIKNEAKAEAANATPYKLMAVLATAAYVLLFPFAPNLILSLFVIMALWCALSSSLNLAGRAGIVGLLVISLPLIPSLNFYAGYPMRLLTAFGAKLMLSCLGLSVSQQGTMLTIQNKLVAIDAPCSGISMVWAAAYIALLMAAKLKLDGKKTAMLGCLTMLIVIAGNIVRAVTLVLFDAIAAHQENIAKLLPEPIVHLGVGLLVFALSAGAIIVCALKLRDTNKENLSIVESEQKTYLRAHWYVWCQSKVKVVLVPMCLVAALVPFLVHPGDSANPKFYPPQWPTVIAGHALKAVPSLPEENAFARDFPGAMKRFTDGSNAYFVRSVNRETRQLHPSSDCFKGMGYSVDYRPMTVDQDGNLWNTFLAVKQGRSYVVMERLYNLQGQSWTDVSTWYWDVALGQSKGPWWAITMARQATPDETQRTD